MSPPVFIDHISAGEARATCSFVHVEEGVDLNPANDAPTSSIASAAANAETTVAS